MRGSGSSSSSSHESSSSEVDDDESLPELEGEETRAQEEGAAGLEPTEPERRDGDAVQS